MKNTFLFFVAISLFGSTFAQLAIKKYTRNITNNSENEIAPCLSMDGNTIVFTRKRAMDDGWKTQIVKKEGDIWQRAEDFETLNEHSSLRLLGSYCLNKDATQVMFVSKRSGGIGGFDIWSSTLKGSTWSPAENLGKPLNSKLDEINPCFSLDGKSIFYTQLSPNSENGKIFYSTNKGYVWSTPIEIDFGGEFYSVKIAPDNQTIYLSKLIGTKTKLYYSNLVNGKWSKAQEIIGMTENVSQFFTLDARTATLTISSKEEETYDIYQTLLSKESLSIPVSDLSIKTDAPHRVEIKKTSSEEIVYRGNDLNEFYLLNNDSYTLSVIFKDYFPVIYEVNLQNAPHNEKTLNPSLIKLEKGNLIEIQQMDTEKDLNERLIKGYISALQLVLEANPTKTFQIVFYQSNITLDSVASETHNLAIVDTIPIDTIPIDSISIEKTYFSNDKTESVVTSLAENLGPLPSKIKIVGEKISPSFATKPMGIYIKCN